MPGVPSGKGCDACQRQKKKCDQLKPACSRCARLRIPCIGSGQQRYKFKQVKLPSEDSESRRSSVSTTPTVGTLSRSPSNEETFLIREFVHNLEVRDVRFDLCWGYGPFLKSIPQRINSNPALEASVISLTATSTYLSSGQLRSLKALALTRYGNALKVLRTCLDDPVIARSPDTLCAILFIWICHGWIGSDDGNGTTHGRAIAQILATMSRGNVNDEYERQLLVSVGASVTLEGVFYSQTRLNPWMISFLLKQETSLVEVDQKDNDEAGTYPGGPRVGRLLATLLRLPEYVQFDPDLLPEIRASRGCALVTARKLRELLTLAAAALDETPSPPQDSPFGSGSPVSPLTPAQRLRIHAHYQRLYSICLFLATMLNGILQAYEPENDAALQEDAIRLSDEILSINEQSRPYRPLGATLVPMGLTVAWATVRDPERRDQIRQAYEEYWEEVKGRDLYSQAFEVVGVYDRLRRGCRTHVSTSTTM